MSEIENINQGLGIFMALGFSKYQFKLYRVIFIEGTLTCKEMSDITGIPYGKIYELVNDLILRGAIEELPEKPMRCKAVSPKRLLDDLKEGKIKALKGMDEIVDNVLQPYYNNKNFTNDNKKDIFIVTRGRKNANHKINILIESAKKEIKILCSGNGLSRIIWFKEQLFSANKFKDIKIDIISSNGDKDIAEEIKSLDFCKITKSKSKINGIFIFTEREGLLIKQEPENDDIVNGFDTILHINSIKMLENLNMMFEMMKR